MRLMRVEGHIWCIWHLSLHLKHFAGCKLQTFHNSSQQCFRNIDWVSIFRYPIQHKYYHSFIIERKLLDNSFLGYTYEIFSSQTFFHHRTKLLNILVVNKSHEKLLFVIAARCNNIGYKNKMYMNDCVDNLFIDPNKLHFSTFFAFLSTIYIYTIISHTIWT